MRDIDYGTAVRVVRRRLGWRQTDLARRAGVSQQFISRLEAGRLECMAFQAIRRCGEALGMHVGIDARWRGTDLPRLLDAGHAALQELWKRKLERLGWAVRVEVSFSEYGERGRVDLLCFHPVSGVLLVGEIKTAIVDLQELLGALDVKLRLAPRVAARLGWHSSLAVPCLLVANGSTSRRRLAEYASLFGHFDVRGRRALSWLRTPTTPATGLLILSQLPPTRGRRTRSESRNRVRPSARGLRSAASARAPSGASARL